MPSLSNFFYTQLFLRIPKPTASFAGQTVIVTGANGGLGKETAKHLVRLGASKVILACRSRARGVEAQSEIAAATGCGPSTLEVWELDLESPASIKQFADRASAALPRLDVLVNNAGVRAGRFRPVLGTEQTLAVNCIGTFLLTLQLLPALRATARRHAVVPRVTTVGSALYDVAKYPDLGGADTDVFGWVAADPARFSATGQYDLSKLLQLYGVIQLSRLVGATTADPSPIVVNTLDPCFCGTGLGGDGLADASPAARAGFAVFKALFARSAEEGARLVVQAAAAGRESHGRYFRSAALREYAPLARDEAKAAHTWEALCRRMEELQPGVLENLK